MWSKPLPWGTITQVFVGISFVFLGYKFYEHLSNQETQLMLDKHKRKEVASLSSEEMSLASCVIDSDLLGTTFDDIGGLVEVKKKLYEETVLPLLRPDLFRGALSAPKGILLYGPPGTGKTMLARAIAKETQAVFIEVKLSSIVSKWYGETVKNASAVFSLAKKLQPSILFFDEIDSVFRDRNQFDHETNHQMKCTFMTLWDGLTSDEKNSVLVIGATNRPWDLDEAIRRRMPKQLFVDVPNEEHRREILKIIFQKHNIENEVDAGEISKITPGFTGSDLHELCRDALQIPIREACYAIRANTLDQENLKIRKASMEDFIKALEYIHPVYSDRKAFIQYNHTNRSSKSRS